VETEIQMRMLRLLKCDEMQGYLISRPVPVDEFEKQFLQENFNLDTWWPTAMVSPLQAFDANRQL
jgi:predicted signal transduction protein with EAL and GGDEF domain